MKLQWEMYFLRREKELEKERKQRQKKSRLSAVLLALCCIVLLGAVLWRSSSSDSDYEKIKKAADAYDYRLPAAKMSGYLNQKYGEGTCRMEELNVHYWDPGTEREYLGFEGVYQNNRKKKVYLLYLSQNDFVFLDTFQWEEISEDLEQEAAALTGMPQVSVDTARAGDLSLSETDYYCPWRQAGAYISYYEGDLETFFREEEAARKALRGSEHLEEGLSINGCLALYFSADSVPDMAARVENPEAVDLERYEKSMVFLEEKYHLDLFSCVLVQSHYTELLSALAATDTYSFLPTRYADYHKGGSFYNLAFTLASYAYGDVYEIRAEKAAEGIYLFGEKQVPLSDIFPFQETKLQDGMEAAAEEALKGWEYQECFSLNSTEKPSEYINYPCVFAIDSETRYDGKNIALMEWGYSDWEILEDKTEYPAGIYRDYHIQDGFYIINGRNGYDQSLTYGIWCR